MFYNIQPFHDWILVVDKVMGITRGTEEPAPSPHRTRCHFLIPWAWNMFLEISKPLHFWLGTLLELFSDLGHFPYFSHAFSKMDFKSKKWLFTYYIFYNFGKLRSCMRHYHLQRVQVMENKTNLTLLIYFLYLQKELLQIHTTH